MGRGTVSLRVHKDPCRSPRSNAPGTQGSGRERRLLPSKRPQRGAIQAVWGGSPPQTGEAPGPCHSADGPPPPHWERPPSGISSGGCGLAPPSGADTCEPPARSLTRLCFSFTKTIVKTYKVAARWPGPSFTTSVYSFRRHQALPGVWGRGGTDRRRPSTSEVMLQQGCRATSQRAVKKRA